jgi:hypothetical protein
MKIAPKAEEVARRKIKKAIEPTEPPSQSGRIVRAGFSKMTRAIWKKRSGPELMVMALTASAFAGSVAIPITLKPDFDFHSPKSWVILLSCVGTAAYLKFSEKWKRTKKLEVFGQRKLARRKLTASRIITALTSGSHINSKPANVDKIRSDILQCITATIEDMLDLDEGQRLVANLLDFSTGTLDKMRVVARSSAERHVGSEHPSKFLVAYDAIIQERVEVVDDIQDHPYWNGLHRPYRSVLAIPICRNGKAFGAMSIDSEAPNVFTGVANEVVSMIVPYLSMLAATYADTEVCSECNYG